MIKNTLNEFPSFLPVLQTEVSSARRIAVGRRGMTTMPATAQRTVWREETAAPTTNPPAKVHDTAALITVCGNIRREIYS